MAELAPASCVLCCNTIDNVSRFNTVGVCNHPGCCSICALRLRQLLGQTACVMCKTDMPRVICVVRGDQRFESFQDWGDNIGPEHVFDEVSAMFFLKEDYAKRIRKLRDPLCKKCGKKFASVAALRTHVLDVHGLQYCGICLDNKKVFLEELELLTKEQLKKHNTKGNPREGFMGHPRCDFCFSRFYSTTELYDHLRKNHFECDICLYQMHVQNRYYKDYNDLENHFRADHFLCEERTCLAKKFVVFKSHLDLQAHLTVDHPHIKTSRKVDVHFTVRRASQGDEEEFPSSFQHSTENHTINVADFPSLSGSDSAAAGPSFSLWENQTVSHRRTAEDFPALASSSSSNRAVSGFRNALAPPPSAALRAHMDNNGWEYENPDLASAAAVLGANNPLLGALKPARKNNRGKNRGRKSGGGLEEKLTAPAPAVEEDESESENDEPMSPAPSKTALVLKIRQVLGSDAKYEVFREDCKRFRLGAMEVPDFYAKMRDLFSTTDFSQLFLPLMRLSPDKEQVDMFFAHHKQMKKQRTKTQGYQESTSKRNKKTAKQQQSGLKQKASTPRQTINQRQPPAQSQSGWGNAMKEIGVKTTSSHKPSAIVHNTNLRTMLGRDTQPTTQWSSSGSWQAPATPAASSVSAYPSLGRTPASTKLQSAPADAFASLSVSSSPSSSTRYGATASAYASTPSPVLSEISAPPPAPSFKTTKSDFPELPKAAKPIGVQPVTRATWDDQVQAIAQNRAPNADGGRGNGKKKQKKKTMSLQEMAMHFG